jgi:L-fuconolactonase
MGRVIDGAIHVWDANAASPGRSAEQLLTTLDSAGVFGAVCVHSRRDSGYDHTATARAIAEHPDRLVGVCVVDPVSADGPARLRELVGQGFKGVRVLPFSEQDTPWLAGASGDPLWQEAARLGVPVDVILLPHQLEQVRERALRSPDVTVVIDHMALITSADAPDRLALLLACAELPNVVCKVSALMHASAGEFPHRDIHPIIRAVVDAYGPDRVIYGSDWPNMLETGVPYDYAINTIDEALRLSAPERDQVFGETAARVWNFAPAVS